MVQSMTDRGGMLKVAKETRPRDLGLLQNEWVPYMWVLVSACLERCG